MAIIIKFKVPRKAVPQVMGVMDADGVPEHNMAVRRLKDGKCEIEIQSRQTSIYDYYRKVVDLMRYGQNTI